MATVSPEASRTIPEADSSDDRVDADGPQSETIQPYRDADGDGYEACSGSVSGYTDGVIAGFAPSTDCDDTDAATQVWAYVDADGDGIGAGNRQCVGADAARFATESGDCDDANPQARPNAEEAPLDGVDADCDGFDFPIKFGPPAVLTLPQGSRCEGAALGIVAVEQVRWGFEYTETLVNPVAAGDCAPTEDWS